MSHYTAARALNSRLLLTADEIRSSWRALVEAADRPDLREQVDAILADINMLRAELFAPLDDGDTQPIFPVGAE